MSEAAEPGMVAIGMGGLALDVRGAGRYSGLLIGIGPDGWADATLAIIRPISPARRIGFALMPPLTLIDPRRRGLPEGGPPAHRPPILRLESRDDFTGNSILAGEADSNDLPA